MMARGGSDRLAPAASVRVASVQGVPHRDRDLLRWGEALAAIARTGLAFTKNLFDAERYEEVLNIAGEIRATAAAGTPGEPLEVPALVRDWLGQVRPGVEGYVTPKVAVGAIVGDECDRILLVKRADSGVWLYPTGWADVGYSAAEVAVKEVREETGIESVPVRLAMVLDGLRRGFTELPLYSLVFLLRPTGGSLSPHPLECTDVGWFAEKELPSPLAHDGDWTSVAFAAMRGEVVETLFDEPRLPPWRREVPGAGPAD